MLLCSITISDTREMVLEMRMVIKKMEMTQFRFFFCSSRFAAEGSPLDIAMLLTVNSHENLKK